MWLVHHPPRLSGEREHRPGHLPAFALAKLASISLTNILVNRLPISVHAYCPCPLLLLARRCSLPPCAAAAASGVPRAPSRGRRVGERCRSARRTPDGEPVSWPALTAKGSPGQRLHVERSYCRRVCWATNADMYGKWWSISTIHVELLPTCKPWRGHVHHMILWCILLQLRHCCHIGARRPRLLLVQLVCSCSASRRR